MPGYELIGKEEKNQVLEIFEKSNTLFRHGFDDRRNNVFKVRDFENEFSKKFGCSDALAVTSGTAALKVALEALSLKEGDEIITQAFTFVATVEAIVEANASPVICEIDRSLNIDPTKLENLITNKTRAIIVVHMLGVPCDMESINKIANKHNLKIIEDTAWGCGAKYKDKYLGTIGDIGTFSFDSAKIITTGEGGMIVSKDENLLAKCKAYHDHGHENNPNLPRWKDSRSSSGFNFRMNELQGAVGLAQLEKLEFIIQKQIEVAKRLKSIIDKYNFETREVPDHSEPTYDAFVFFAKNSTSAEKIRSKLIEKGLGTKILPEAITWHFAGDWDHIHELVKNYPKLNNQFTYSRSLLEKSVAIPINIYLQKDFYKILEETLNETL